MSSLFSDEKLRFGFSFVQSYVLLTDSILELETNSKYMMISDHLDRFKLFYLKFIRLLLTHDFFAITISNGKVFEANKPFFNSKHTVLYVCIHNFYYTKAFLISLEVFARTSIKWFSVFSTAYLGEASCRWALMFLAI